jgi:hypothetical protein
MFEKSEGAIKNGFFRDTGNIGHTRHMTNKLKRKPSIMDTPETLATLSTQNKRQKKECSFLIAPSLFSYVYLPVSLDCSFMIAPSLLNGIC